MMTRYKECTDTAVRVVIDVEPVVQLWYFCEFMSLEIVSDASFSNFRSLT
jgi:hypothetical protein